MINVTQEYGRLGGTEAPAALERLTDSRVGERKTGDSCHETLLRCVALAVM